MATDDFADTSAPGARAAYELPLTYGYPFLTLLPRDPQCVFAQWEVPKAHRRRTLERHDPAADGNGRRDMHNTKQVLRLYDFTEAEDDAYIDFFAPDRQTMYIHVESPGRRLGAQIGLYFPAEPPGTQTLPPSTDAALPSRGTGIFIPLVTSNVVQLPPGRPGTPGRPWGRRAWTEPPDRVQMFRAHAHDDVFGHGLTAGSSDFAARRHP